MIKTIRHNSKDLDAIFRNAKNIKSHSLDDGFLAREVMGDCIDPGNWDNKISPQEYLARKFAQFNSNKLYKNDKGYTLHIHSNLWYDFESL